MGMLFAAFLGGKKSGGKEPPGALCAWFLIV